MAMAGGFRTSHERGPTPEPIRGYRQKDYGGKYERKKVNINETDSYIISLREVAPCTGETVINKIMSIILKIQRTRKSFLGFTRRLANEKNPDMVLKAAHHTIERNIAFQVIKISYVFWFKSLLQYFCGAYLVRKICRLRPNITY